MQSRECTNVQLDKFALIMLIYAGFINQIFQIKRSKTALFLF
jgi:hypothetical protein